MPDPIRTWFEINPIPPNPEKPADEDRVKGMEEFIRQIMLPANVKERERCILDPCYAKEKFAEWGGFYIEGSRPELANFKPIPASTVFRVYESEKQSQVLQRHRKKRDEQVVFVLANEEKLDHTPIWRCTYSPYTTGGKQRKAAKPR